VADDDAGSPDVSADEGDGPTDPLDDAVLSGLRELDDDSGTVLIELVETFVHNAAGGVADLRQAVTRGDLEAVSRLAHGLKGSSAVFGATGMASLAARLEALCSPESLGDARDVVTRLEAELRRVRVALGEAGLLRATVDGAGGETERA
jgi:HPt (histidine-containing phosphotransfer) domain-containing protein